MRSVLKINENWQFIKSDFNPLDVNLAPNAGETINLPHTWNNLDGQDGGNDYYRGVCWYVKKLSLNAPDKEEEIWLEFRGAAMIADVYVNGRHLKHHEGGYSSFRVNVTGVLQENNSIAVSVDNRYTRKVYPQKADFTFYGGIYRDVYMIKVPKAHIVLNDHGSDGVRVTPKVDGGRAEVSVNIQTEGTEDGTGVWVEILDAEGSKVSGTEVKAECNKAQALLTIDQVHLWDGITDPYLYTVKVQLPEKGDCVQIPFGCRTFSFDKEKGFFLNGRNYPLCGVARHQDRRGVGNALTKEMHREDMDMILEMGANTIRLAHYQHDQYFYDLCDKTGMIVWAEIPYITEHMPEGKENTLNQMKELVVQNYNHPSIICWGLSNEVTTAGGVSEDLIDNNCQLNQLCHELDTTRPTTMAHVFILDIDSPVVQIPDICSYNLYYGWYAGTVENNDKWFDEFHAKYPDKIIGLSEYGADAVLQYQTAAPRKGDYTEQYQAVYHEHMLEMWKKRPYIWAMHVWNMFDFAADGRKDGGEAGVNHKGLVSFDRKVKKDAFYLYKAYLSQSPFAHLCGRRYVDRAEEVTEIKVYSNQLNVTLYVDGKEFEVQSADKIFRFQVPINGEHHVAAAAGTCRDEIIIRKVSEPNPNYLLQKNDIVNWFDTEVIEVREGFFSVKDTVKEIRKTKEGDLLLKELNEQMSASYGEVARNVEIPKAIRDKMETLRLEEQLKMAGSVVTPELVIQLNKMLNQIPKP